MANYVFTRDNRHYATLESQPGIVPTITAADRLVLNRLDIQTTFEDADRRDKTGTRSEFSPSLNARQQTRFTAKAYHRTNLAHPALPGLGAVLRSALGGALHMFAGGVIQSLPTPQELHLVGPHGLVLGQAVGFGGEMRFVTAVLSATSVQVNAPFTTVPVPGSSLTATSSFFLGNVQPTFSLFDYWSQSGSLNRIVRGAIVDRMKARVNGTYHELEFQGYAMNVIDSATLAAGSGQLETFPAEPTAGPIGGSPVPGHLGQAWLGATPQQLLTLTEATIIVDNNVEERNKEFGTTITRGYASGTREVRLSVSLYCENTQTMATLAEAAQARQGIPSMLQLGTQTGGLFGLFTKSLILPMPRYQDDETRLVWSFEDCRAAGGTDDDLVLALG